jgi:hypothetical protein
MNKPIEAAERLRQALGQGCYVGAAGQLEQDERLVAQWSLSLLDPAPIDEEWLTEIGGRACEMWFDFHVGGWCVDLKRSDFAPRQWAVRIEDERFPDVVTRGQLRMLLAALEGPEQ